MLARAGWAVAWIFQIVPFQYSEAAFAVKLVGPNVAAAVQLLAVVQETPQSPVRLPA